MMFIQNWQIVFSASLLNLWYAFINFVPGLLGAIILFMIGWFVGSIIGKAVDQILSALRLNKIFEQAGANEMMNKMGVHLNVGGFIGSVVKWFIVVVFLMSSLEIMGLNEVNNFLREVVLSYLPKVIIASFVLIIATVLADAMKKLVQASAHAVNIHSANMLGSITRYAIWIFAFIIAFSELGIASSFMQILFTGLVVALSLAFGLAFGLGGRDAASRTIDRLSNDMM